MIIFTQILIVLGLAISTCYAAQFKVICAPSEYGGTGVNVVIDGTSYPMVSQDNFYFQYLFQGKPTSYYYEVTGTGDVSQFSEQVLLGTPRSWDASSTSTLNEVYGRRHTVGDDILKTIPRLYQKREGYQGFTILFQEGEIPVFHVKMTDAEFAKLCGDTGSFRDYEYTVDFDFYTPYEILHYTNVTMGLSGMGSMNQSKKPFKMELSKNENDKSNTEIFDRSKFKLRSLVYDPSYIKNKLAMDMAESLGLPMTQSAHCRLYINNVPFGLYDFSDLYKKKFVRNMFHYGIPKDEVNYGTLFKGVSGEYPAYLYPDPAGQDPDYYPAEVSPPDYADNEYKDLPFLKEWLQSISNSTPLSEIESKFDLDVYLKYMAMEYLVCHWDGYLINGNNFYIYIERDNGKYHVFSFDFDLTFGRWCEAASLEGNLENYVQKGYKKGYGPEARRLPLLYSKLLIHPEVKPKFEEILKNIVENLFNGVAMSDRILYYKEFLKDDIQWDIKARLSIPTKTFEGQEEQTLWTFEEAMNAFDNANYADTGSDVPLIQYISTRAQTVATAYGFSTNFKAEGEYGTVGDKLMALESFTEDGKGAVSGTTTYTTKNILFSLLLNTLLLLATIYLFI